ncbi:hypothetical protein Vafri_16885 [Volvox africanus]|uniref:TF-B3 domain-containing protein n=1 Tax=Volvox africanus TaxID=51714 RepID=A0A8J4BPC3_9CHLO|nr:hypothetical protein Vafri_16885 [Volvox africanus]
MSQPMEIAGQSFLPGQAAVAAQSSQPFPQACLTPMDPAAALLASDIGSQLQTIPAAAAALASAQLNQQQQQQQHVQQQLTSTPQPGPVPSAAPATTAVLSVKNELLCDPLASLQLGLGAGLSSLQGAGAPVGGAGPSAPDLHKALVPIPADTLDPEAAAVALTARMTAAGASIIFEKALTASDVSGGGRVVVPKSVAEQYFPRLDQPSGVTISAADLDGRSYTFKWRFWVNNSSRMYLLEGAGELHRNYGLEVGDVMVFAQKPDGSLVVAGRIAIKSDLLKKAPAKRPTAASAASGGSGGGGGGGGGQTSRYRDSRGARGPPPPPPRSQQQPATTTAPAGVEGGGVAPPPLPAAAAAAAAAANTVAAAAADSYAPPRGRKRKTFFPPTPHVSNPGFRALGDEGTSMAILEMEAPSDGIFRAVVTQHLLTVPPALGVALARNNRWTATLDVAGETYQAFFDTRDDAMEALAAAGASP